MSKLISGKEALIALANGGDVECKNDVIGMDWSDAIGGGCKERWIQFGAWRTEEEIKQVVSALRSIFKGGV